MDIRAIMRSQRPLAAAGIIPLNVRMGEVKEGPRGGARAARLEWETFKEFRTVVTGQLL